MNKIIDIQENKVLKLKNVVCRSVCIDADFSDKMLQLKIKEFDDYIKNNRLLAYGPLIVKNSIVGDQERKVQLTIMIQVKQTNVHVVLPYFYKSEIVTSPCLFSRYEGKPDYSNISQLKMQVYAYEHSFVLDVESYSITKENNDEVIIDTFVPILGRY